MIGLMVNYFNPSGISFLREKKELKWAPDSLFFEPQIDTVTKPIEVNQKLANVDIQKEKGESDSLTNIRKAVPKSTIKEIKKNENQVAKVDSEAISFTEPKLIKLDQAFILYNNGVLFIDARDKSDYMYGHIKNAINIPFEDLDNYRQELNKIPKDKPFVIYCAGTDCDLSTSLGNILFDEGYKKIYVFFGGWIEWSDASYPVEHPSEIN